MAAPLGGEGPLSLRTGAAAATRAKGAGAAQAQGALRETGGGGRALTRHGLQGCRSPPERSEGVGPGAGFVPHELRGLGQMPQLCGQRLSCLRTKFDWEIVPALNYRN